MENLDILKNTILETIHELEEVVPEQESEIEKVEIIEKKEEKKNNIKEDSNSIEKTSKTEEETISNSDINFYIDLRERIITLFEGLQSPEIVKLNEKLDLTLKFLEYVLARIDEKLENA